MKSPALENFLESFVNSIGHTRKTEVMPDGTIKYHCATCGKLVDPATDFKDTLSLKEFGISKMCQVCQDDVSSLGELLDET